MATIRDVATASGLSTATVSHVLNGTRRLPHGTRERVLQAARRLNYHPSAVARGLSRKRMHTLGLVFPRDFSPILRPYTGLVLDGVAEVALRCRQNLTLFTGELWTDAARSLPVYCDGRCDGLLLIAPPVGLDIVPALVETRTPFVLVHDRSDDARVCSINIDDADAARILTKFVLKLGHRRLTMLCGDDDIASVGERQRGVRQAVAEAGLSAETLEILPGRFAGESVQARVRAILAQPEKTWPTVLLCSNDEMALTAMRTLRENGVDVPKQMSVTGFDDIGEAETAGLTTVRQPLRAIGERAAEMLLHRIESRTPSDASEYFAPKEVIPTELVVRASTAAPLPA